MVFEAPGALKRAHFNCLPAFKNTTNIQRKDPQEREERMKIVAGEGKKKERNFGRSGGGGPAEEPRRVGPRRVGPQGWVLEQWGPEGLQGVGLRVFGVYGFGFCGLRKFGQNKETINLTKVGLAKVGQKTKMMKQYYGKNT